MEAALAEVNTAVEEAVKFKGLVMKEKEMYGLREFSLEHASRTAADAAAAAAAIGRCEEDLSDSE